ncbi:MAG: hypothetical protein ACKO8G_03750 [Actinomycetota bacterium]
MRRILLVVVGLAVLVAVFLAVRPRSDTQVPAPMPPETGAPAPAPSTGAPTEPAAPTPTVVEVSVAAGEVTGPGEVSVVAGTSVVIRVDADVADEAHLHGYDLHADVAPGAPGEIAFVADAPGVFEVELEGAGLPLLSLTVTP